MAEFIKPAHVVRGLSTGALLMITSILAANASPQGAQSSSREPPKSNQTVRLEEKIVRGQMEPASPENAKEARKAAFSYASQIISDAGIGISKTTIYEFEKTLVPPSDVTLNPIANGPYLNEALFSGKVLGSKIIKNCRKKGIVKASVNEFREALKSLCPIWPFC
jgi:hypothetical protein